jgi:hypothetical protein
LPYEPGRADFPHPALGQDFTPSKLAGLAEELAAKLDSTNVPSARMDAKEVAERIREDVDMPHGTRPYRFEVDPQQRRAITVADKANEMRKCSSSA